MTDASFKESLLPSGGTKLDVAQELTDANRFPLDTGIIRRTKDAMLVDEPLLPVLAWERSVDVWNNKWPLAKKRYVTDIAFAMQKMKGRRDGLKKYIEVSDAECLLIEAPPLMAFPGRDMTDAERLAWLARFAQLRTYKYSITGNDQFAIFTTSDSNRPLCFSDTVNRMWCAREINGLEYWGWQTHLWDNGVDTPLTTWDRVVTEIDKTVNVYTQVVLPGDLNGAWFLDHDPTPGADGEIGFFPTSLDPVADRTVSVLTDQTDYLDHNVNFTSRTVSPGLQPIYIKPERVAENAPTKLGDWYLDHFPTQSALPFVVDAEWGYFPSADDRAALHIFDRLYLYQKGRGPVPMPPDARCFLDHTYFQFPAFTAYTRVGITGTLPKWAFKAYLPAFLVDEDLDPLWETVDAIKASKSARDKIKIDTQAHDVVRPSNGLICGQAICGTQVGV
jgi:hypothetical protein